MKTKPAVTAAHVDAIVTQLRDASVGRYQWQVRDIDTHVIYIWVEDYEDDEARHWWSQNRHEYDNAELSMVHVLDRREKLMRDAATLILKVVG